MSILSQGTPPTLSDLDKAISQARFSTFQAAASGNDDLARQLYLWNRDLSVAFLADIAILEVALRNAMHDAASKAWGSHWYSSQEVVLDDRSTKQLNTAWTRLPKNVQRHSTSDDVPGRLVAHCMFGFWTNLLDAGDHTGKEPRRFKADYEILWKVFKKAFPGGRIEARNQRLLIADSSPQPHTNAVKKKLADTVFTRAWVHRVCKNINELRNRVAHHEAIINGIPLAGQQQRLSVKEAHEQCMVLARIIDRRLAAWMEQNTAVPGLLSNRPN